MLNKEKSVLLLIFLLTRRLSKFFAPQTQLRQILCHVSSFKVFTSERSDDSLGLNPWPPSLRRPLVPSCHRQRPEQTSEIISPLGGREKLIERCLLVFLCLLWSALKSIFSASGLFHFLSLALSCQFSSLSSIFLSRSKQAITLMLAWDGLLSKLAQMKCLVKIRPILKQAIFSVCGSMGIIWPGKSLWVPICIGCVAFCHNLPLLHKRATTFYKFDLFTWFFKVCHASCNQNA